MPNSSSKKSLTIIIAVYNGVRNLEFIFAALARQSMNNFEVIIADDGSGPEIRKLIERSKPRLPFPVNHLWQADQGFRKNVMLNKSIEAAQTDYLAFIDGDCLPHRHFLKDHWNYRETNGLLCGRRVNLSKQMTDALSLMSITSGQFEKFSIGLLWDGMLARSSNLEDGLRIGNDILRKLIPFNKARILGCNFSVEKKMLEQINGFNEDYLAPGIGEDTDIAYRLSLIGAKFISLRYLAVLYHLFHPPTQVGGKNKELFDLTVALGDPVCRNGLRKIG
jgi:glycosyltransferase involved in cell wall biosynthesis